MTDDVLVQDAARADLCRFLAACFYEPGPEFAQEKLFDSLLEAARHVDQDLARDAKRLGEAFAAERIDDLLVDYTRLFLGPTGALAMPYGSAWLGTEKTLMQDSTMAVLGLYEEGGFEIADDFRELPDHIAAELEFLYLLLFRESQARHAGDSGGEAQAAGLRKRLLDEHLARWAGPFADAVREGAQSDFYRELGTLANGFIAKEAVRARAQADRGRVIKQPS